MTKKKKKSNAFFIFLFILGFLILLYPQFSQLYYRVQSNEHIDQFESGKSELDEAKIARRMELAAAYNASLFNHIPGDPYSDDKKEEGKAEYAKMLEIKEQMGHINIPRINSDIPIYAGTSDEVLAKGAGHLEGTSLPIGGNYTHTVITAHRGLPTARLFTDLDRLEAGDKFFIHNMKEVLAYQVDQVKVVEPSNFSDLLIVPGHDYATLLTCTPIMINSHRLLVRGHRVPYEPLEEQQLMKDNRMALLYRYAFYAAVAMLLVLILLNIYFMRERKKIASQIDALERRDRIRDMMDRYRGGESDDEEDR